MALSTSLIFNIRRNEPEMVRPLHKSCKSNHIEIKTLSDIDDQGGLHIFIPTIFFYPPLSDGQTLDPIKTIKEGLAKALEVYYPLAGRIFEGPNRKLMINCNNEGVVFVEAHANVKLEQLGNGKLMPWPYLEKLFCDVPKSSDQIIGSPLHFFQVTSFICGGFSLGIWSNHTAVDGYGLKLFLSAIGDLIKGASTPSIPPVWERELLSARSPPTITCIHNEFVKTYPSNKPLVYHNDTFVLTSVFFGPKELQALRSKLPVSSHLTSISSFDMITACLWKCRTIALEPHPDDIVRVSLILDGRSMKGVNLPRGYYGNGLVSPAAKSKADILCASPLAYALDLVWRTKVGTTGEYIKSVADLMAIKGRPTFWNMWNFVVTDLRKIGLDKMDLGWGKPWFGGAVPFTTPMSAVYNKMKNEKGQEGVLVFINMPSLALDKFQRELMKMTHSHGSSISSKI